MSHTNHNVPRWPFSILRAFCPEQLLEEIEGDLLQRFESDRTSKDIRHARRRLIWGVIVLFRPGILFRHRGAREVIPIGTWQNYLRITVRTLSRNKLYSFINVIGLSLGIASAVLILLWVQYQYSFDDFAANRDRIHQIKINLTYNGTINTEDNICVPVYTTLKEEKNLVRDICFTSNTFGHLLGVDKTLTNKEVLAVSKEFLAMFGISLVRGNVQALDDPHSILLNESTARELFGDSDPVNRFVRFDNDEELKVTGVFKDVPRNSTFWFHALIPIRYYDRSGEWLSKQWDRWDEYYPRIYVELQPEVAVSQFDNHIRGMIGAHVKDTTVPELFTQPLNRVYLYDHFTDGKEAGGGIDYVHLFTGAAIFILAIACINYMNLSTARSERRAREVGVRKCIGSRQSDIVQQFLFESGFITFFAFALGFIFVTLMIPYYNDIVNARLSIFSAVTFENALWLVTLFAFCALVAGSYPAFYYSSLRPVKVLKGVFTNANTSMPRKLLMTFQHVVSILLLVGMAVIYLQIDHAKTRDLGYNQSNLVCYAVNEEIDNHYTAIKNELMRSGAADAVTIANQGIDVDYFTDFVEWEGKQTEGKVIFTRISTQYDYTQAHEIRMLEGRDFSPDHVADSGAVVINQTAANLIGYADPIGKKISIREGERTIIGVMADVLRGSPFEPVRPLYMGMLKDGNNHVTIRLNKNRDLATSLTIVNEVFKKMDPLNVDEPQFVDERFADNFRRIEMMGNLSNVFATLAVVLTSLGILGLAVYTTEQRMREIAIRKVLGANFRSLLLLLSNFFVRVVLIAVLLAAPISWLMVQNFLQGYSYRIAFPWLIIPCASFAMLILTLLIVLTQVAKTQSRNTVHVLKAE